MEGEEGRVAVATVADVCGEVFVAIGDVLWEANWEAGHRGGRVGIAGERVRKDGRDGASC